MKTPTQGVPTVCATVGRSVDIIGKGVVEVEGGNRGVTEVEVGLGVVEYFHITGGVGYGIIF